MIDVVFIDADPNSRPWESSLKKIADLFIQCKEANKPMWVSGCGVQMLVYYCATNYRNINVINESNNRRSLNTLKKIANLSMDSRNAIINNQTGDFFLINSVFYCLI